MAQQNDAGGTMKIGDFVTFKNLKFDGFLIAEGILREDIVVSSSTGIFDDTIFAVHLKRQYSASRELEEYYANGLDSDSSAQKYLHALKRGRDNEKLLNDRYMQTRLGEDVKFGDIIQLFHLKSGKYLRVYPQQLAVHERQNLQIKLDATGDIYSWLQIMPRYKIDRVGDPVHSKSEVYLVVAERSSEFVHASERTLMQQTAREVNCSLEPSSWQMTIFQSSIDSREAHNRHSILASQLVHINDPELRCNLTIGLGPLESLDEGTERVTAIEDGDETNYFHEFGDIVLEPADPHPNSRALWFIEARQVTKGGPINWKLEQVRFKHLNTALYLSIKNRSGSSQINGDESQDDVILTTTFDGTDPSTLFTVSELHGANKLLGFGKPVNISRGLLFIERGPHVSGLVSAAKIGVDKVAAIGFKIFRYHEATTEDEEEGADEDKESQNEPLDVYAGISARFYLNKYLGMTVIPKTNTVGTIWPSAQRSDVELFAVMMHKVTAFSQGFPISSHNVNLDEERCEDKLRIRRQDLLRDQGLLKVLLQLTNKLIPISNKVDDSPKLLKNAAKVSDEEQALIAMGRDVLSKCFTLMYWLIKDHPDNQMYVADHMPVLLAHLGGQRLAGKCVTEMLANNMELQETKIGTREIAIFVEKLRSSKMNAMYLQLLQACCSCQGDGVDGNQCKVTELLFSNTNDIIISLHADKTRLVQVTWDPNSLYIPFTPIPGSTMRSEDFIRKGLPKLSLSWTTNSIDFSPLGLFGKLSVDVQDLYRMVGDKTDSGGDGGPASAAAKNLNQKKSASAQQKQAVANYFIAEVFLAAEMCMDRNYVAMNTLDRMFPYEVLVAILKLEVSDKLQAAAARLLLCLHIDRDPQGETKIPCLTRTWSEIIKSQDTEPKLPYVEPGRRYTYGLVQDILSEHVRNMANRRWQELSKYMLHLLKKMVSFNFYGTTERLRDVIGPLIKACDRRSMKGSQEDSLSASRSRSQSQFMSAVNSKDRDDNTKDNVDASQGGEDDSNAALETKQVMWQEPVLEFMESIPTMLAVLTVVLAGVAGTLYQIITNATDEFGSWLFIFQLAVLLFFIIEIGVRSYCHIVVRKSVWSFLASAFNQIDIFVILIDIVFMSLGSELAKGGVIKTLRLVRMIRLLRILRAARVIVKVAKAFKAATLDAWVTPARYSKVPGHEVEAMVEAVEVLGLCQSLIEDRNLTIFLKYFYKWENGLDVRSPGQIFEDIIREAEELSLGIEDFDNVFVDLLMFNSAKLVQGCLEVLQSHHSTRKTLLENAAQVQLLVSTKRERQFKIVNQMLQQLERNAETHELWGELKTEGDHLVNKQTKDIIKELIDICRIRRKVLEFGESYESDRDIQDLFRNLSCSSICMKVLNLLESVEEDENGMLDEVGANTKELCLLCNTLLYWFLLGNAQNQACAFDELEFFLDSLDKGIDSHNIIKAIFKNNEKLMRLCPHKYLANMTELICESEPDLRSPFHLVLMLSLTNIADKGIKENQLEIMKLVTSPGRLQKVSSFFVPVTHPDYARKRQLMSPFLVRDTLNPVDLPLELQYHFALVEVLTNLTVGKLGGITTIEAKVQSVVHYTDIIESILDSGSILYARIRLGLFLYNAVIDVELKAPRLEYASSMWKLLRFMDSYLSSFHADMYSLHKMGWSGIAVPRQKIEFHLVCISIIGGFFSKYFDATIFRVDENTFADKYATSIAELDVDGLLGSLYNKIRPVRDMNCRSISAKHRELIVEAVKSLINSSLGKLSDVAVIDEGNADEDGDGGEGGLEAKVTQKYQEFIQMLRDDDSVMTVAEAENNDFIKLLEGIPFIIDDVESDIRQEPLYRKLVVHIRERITIVNGEKHLDARCTKTAIWIIKAFRTMIENRMGMSIFDRDEEGGQEQDEAAAPVIDALNSCGATTLVLDLIAKGIDPVLQQEAIKLGVGLLFKEGGAQAVQHIMNTHLNNGTSDFFFEQIRATIQKLIDWHKWNGVIELEEGADVDLPDDMLTVRFIQLTCEGHYLPNQNIFREQPHNANDVNILEDLVNYFNTLSRIHCRTSSSAMIQVGAAILEVIQGPCTGNQSHFAMKTELLESLNRVLRFKTVLDCDASEEVELKTVCVDIFKGLLEGQSLRGAIYERVVNVIHFDIILTLSGNDAGAADQERTEEEAVLDVECTVLLLMLCDCKPSLRRELGLSENLLDVVDDTSACVEVMWNKELHRVFFYVPEICNDLAKSSMNALVENVNRNDLENQLVDFMERTNGLYREVLHQQVLKKWGVSSIFSKKVHDKTTWFSFFLACAINALLVRYYQYSWDNDNPNASKPFLAKGVGGIDVANVILYLNIVQIVFAVFNLVLALVVESPVKYQSLIALNSSPLDAFFRTAMEPMTLYYFGYLLLCVLGAFLPGCYYLLSFLILDIIVKNATTRSVLMSVYQPRAQLGAISVLSIFILYIYAFFVFLYFRDGDFLDTTDPGCHSLWHCFIYVFAVGLRQGGGVGDIFTNNIYIKERYLLDITFFFVMLVCVMNLLSAIIIMTFSVLRDERNERLEKTENYCFICGIERLEFDRASEKGDGFQLHIKYDQNMWSYVKFMIFLWEQDQDDDDGLEQYVRRCVASNDINWFPMNKAIRLNESSSLEEELTQALKARVHQAESVLTHKLLGFQSEVTVVLEQVTQALKTDHKGSLEEDSESLFDAFKLGVKGFDFQPREGVVTVHSDESDFAAPKDLYIELRSLSGAAQAVRGLKDVFAAVQCKSRMYLITGTVDEEGHVTFEPVVMHVTSSATADDERACKVGILTSLDVDGNISPGNTLGVVELSFGELVYASNCNVEKFFPAVSSFDLCCLTVSCSDSDPHKPGSLVTAEDPDEESQDDGNEEGDFGMQRGNDRRHSDISSITSVNFSVSNLP